MESIHCAIYRCEKKEGMYLYILEKDDFSDVPKDLLVRLGEKHFVMELDLTPDRTLAREDVNHVINNLKQKGVHLQMPTSEQSMSWWSNEKLKEPDSPSKLR